MSEILLNWLNNDVKLSSTIEPNEFPSAFSNGYLIGELLYKFGLQDDFHLFSQSQSSEARLNNFSRIEPTMALLDVKFDSNIAKEIIHERPGMATRLLYQLFIALGKKTKMNLTGFAMEAMRPQGPARLGAIETEMYKERLKTLVPRQVDLDFDDLVSKYNKKQKQNDEKALKAKMEEDERIKAHQQHIRQQGLDRSRQIREQQDNVMAKIKEATVKIPKPPQQKKTSGLTKKEYEKKKEVESVYKSIDQFEKRLKNTRTVTSPESSDQIREIDADIEMFLNESPTKQPKVSDFVKPEDNEDYIMKIRQRLNEDSHARKEREKRRRRVLVQQLQAHQAQQEAAREDELVNRLMRQSQVERRIAVQLMHIRHEKETIKKNRMEKERQFTERRLKDFQDALDREAEMCRLARKEYEEEVKRNKEIHDAIAAERARQKYEKHYGICREILLDIVDFSCKVGEYRELTEKLLPPKLVREWKALFMNSKPLYDTKILEVVDNDDGLDDMEESKQNILDDEDFTEYKNFVGEWLPSEGNSQQPPKDNAVLGVILKRLNDILYPPTPPPEEPKFPAFPIKACVVGKFFSGKTTAVRKFAESHRVEILDLQEIVEDALQAWHDKEQVQEIFDGLVENTDAPLQSIGEEKNTDDSSKENEEAVTNKEELTSPNEVIGQKNDDIIIEEISKENENIMKDNSQVSLKMAEPKEMLTARARLGGKANSFLRKSKVVPDSILVDIMVDRIRNLPDGTGWIMDGFPGNVQQAKLLEKALTGYEPIPSPQKSTTRDGKKSKKSKLAPDPTPPVEVKPPVSGINAVLLFNISNEVVLKRAEGRKYDTINGEEYHEEFDPPPEGTYTGLQNKSKVQSVIDLSNDREQAQVRITTFQDNWPKLEKWFQRFNILEQVDADVDKETLAGRLEQILEDTMEKLKTPLPTELIEEATAIELVSNEEVKSSEETEAAKEVKVEAEEIPPEISPSLSSKADIKDTPSKSSATKGKKNTAGKEKESPSPTKAKDNESPSPKKGKKDKNNRSSRSPSPKKASDSLSKHSSSSARSRSRSKSPAKSDADIAVSYEEIPPQPPSPEPGTLEWVYVEQPIELEFVEILLSNWDIVEEGYIRSCKHVFRRIREENENVFQYFYKTRKHFVEFLKRPDAKQIFVSEWQKDYNAFPGDMRNDEEAKAELHQRVDDLCDRLWDICDNRKEEAEQERYTIMTEGWLEDRIGILVNHFISLMQTEVDRYQQTCKMLRDYYVAMDIGVEPQKVKLISEGMPNFTRLPLVDLPATKPPVQPEPPVEQDGASYLSPNQSSTTIKPPPPKTPEVNEEKEEGRIPLVPRRPNSSDVSPTRSTGKRATPRKDRSSEDKMDSPLPPVDADEKLLHDAIMAAFAVIEAQAAIDLADDENELIALKAERSNELTKSISKDRKSVKKDRKSPTKSKGHIQQTTPVPSTNAVDTVSEEDQLKALAHKKMKKEYKNAVQSEGVGLKVRLEAIKTYSSQMVKKLKEKAESTYIDLDNWLGKRFTEEMDSIEKMCEVIRQAIENEQLLQNASVLEDKEFFINDDLHVYRTPTPPRPQSPKEDIHPDMFTCVQLDALNKQFCEISPFGMIPVKMFHDIIMSLPSSTVGMETIPEIWINITPQQLENLTEVISLNNEYINRRSFMLHICKPYPEPTLFDLMETANNLKAIDKAHVGFVTKEDFMKCEIWIDKYRKDQDNNTTPGYDRCFHMKEIFFNVFAIEKAEGNLLDYMDMLLYFVHADFALEGLLAALSLLIGEVIASPVTRDQSGAGDDGENEQRSGKEEIQTTEEKEPKEKTDVPVSIEQWVTVFTHGKRGHGGDHRFNVEDLADSLQKLKEALRTVYEDLGFTSNESIALNILYIHPLMRDMMNACVKYQSKDITAIFKMDVEEEEQ